MEGCEWVLTYRAFVDVIPHLHAHQHYSDIQWSVKLTKTGILWGSHERELKKQSRRDLHVLNFMDMGEKNNTVFPYSCGIRI